MTAAYIRDSLEAPEVIRLSDCWTVSFRELCHRLVEYFLGGRVFRKHLKWRPVRIFVYRPGPSCSYRSFEARIHVPMQFAAKPAGIVPHRMFDAAD